MLGLQKHSLSTHLEVKASGEELTTFGNFWHSLTQPVNKGHQAYAHAPLAATSNQHLSK
jgi:hypothetical protein